MGTMSTNMSQKPAADPRRSSAAIFWGVILVAAGLFFFLENQGLIPSPDGRTVGWAFAAVGLAILASFLAFRAHWWTLIAGSALLMIGAVILLPGSWSGGIFLGGLGMGFAVVALTNLERWWAIIPAGTLLTLAAVATFSEAIGGAYAGVLLFLGMSATFGVLMLIPVPGGRLTWPAYPALGLLGFAIFIGMVTQTSSVFFPLLLIVAGLALLVRASMRRAG